MKKNLYWIIGIVLAVAAFVGIYYLYNNLKDEYAPDQFVAVNTTQATEPSQETTTAPTDEAPTSEQLQLTPDFTVYDAQGNEVQLSDYFGKPIVLNFWASWCPPCKSEMPHFQAAFSEHPDIQFLMVNMTSGDNMDDAKAFIAENAYTFPVLFDTTGEAGYVYQASSLPMTLFIDENGVLITYAIGALSAESLNQGISYIKTAAE